MSITQTAKRSISSDDVAHANVLPVIEAELHPDQIELDPNQPRKLPSDYLQSEAHAELMASIRSEGVLQAIIVRPLYIDSLGHVTKYRLVSGERRVLACRAIVEAEHAKRNYNFEMRIPAGIRNDLDDQRALKIQIEENEKREDLSDVDKAAAYLRYKEMMAKRIRIGSVTWDDVADEFGISKQHITRLIKLLKLPEEVKDDLRKGDLSSRQASAIVKNTNSKDEAKTWASRAKRYEWGGDEIERRILEAKGKAAALIGTDPQTPVQTSRGTTPEPNYATQRTSATAEPPVVEDRGDTITDRVAATQAIGSDLQRRFGQLEINPPADKVSDPITSTVTALISDLQDQLQEYSEAKEEKRKQVKAELMSLLQGALANLEADK